MSPELEERIYGSVRRMVLWGEPREAVFQMLRVNSIAGAEAEALYGQAWRERVAMLRGDAIRKIIKGSVLLPGGVALFCFYWFYLGWITRSVIIISGFMVLVGFWWLVSGCFEIFLAPTKKGSVTPDLA